MALTWGGPAFRLPQIERLSESAEDRSASGARPYPDNTRPGAYDKGSKAIWNSRLLSIWLYCIIRCAELRAPAVGSGLVATAGIDVLDRQ